MKKLPLLLLVLLFGGVCFGQELPINCATNTPCTQNGPINSKTGDPLWQVGYKLNFNFNQIFSAFGSYGLLRGNGPLPNPLTPATYADVAALFTGCSSTTPALGYQGTCVSGGGSGITLQTNGANNASQTTLNLVGTGNVAVTNTTGGTVNIGPVSEPVNAQTGTSYTIASTDCGKQVTFDNASAVAVTVPQATGTFSTCQFDVTNTGVGTVTLTPTTSTINGAISLAIAQNRQCTLNSDGTNWQVIGCTALVTGGSGTPENVQVFTASGTWTVPAGSPQTTQVMCIGGGGGGSSGAVEPSGTAAAGGAGGGGGSLVQAIFQTSSLGASVTVTIGAGGTGGAAQTAAGAGLAGTTGGNSTFGAFLTAYGGLGGGFIGANSTGGTGAGLTGISTTYSVCAKGGGDQQGYAAACSGGGAPGGGETPGGTAGSGGASMLGGAGGGGGGGLASTPASLAGAAGGSAGTLVGPAGGAAAGNGNNGSQLATIYGAGTGGSGGGSNASGTGGTGGTGGIGGGGGGGGASETTSGAGGNGGPGECIAITYY